MSEYYVNPNPTPGAGTSFSDREVHFPTPVRRVLLASKKSGSNLYLHTSPLSKVAVAGVIPVSGNEKWYPLVELRSIVFKAPIRSFFFTGDGVPPDFAVIGTTEIDDLSIEAVGSVIPSPLPASIVSIPSVVSAGNSSTAPLLGNGIFTGAIVDLISLGFNAIQIQVLTDQAGTVQIQFSTDGVNFDHSVTGIVTANDSTSIATGIHGRFVRVRYVNGAINQTFFRLQTILCSVLSQPTVKDMDTPMDGDDNALITHGVITGVTTAGGGAFIDVKVNPSGSLQVAGTIAGAVSTAEEGVPNIASGQVSVGNAAPGTQIVAARTTRRGVLITNLGTTDVWIGVSGVTTATGALLPGVRGASITVSTIAAVFGIVGAGSQSVSFLEEYD